MLGFIPGVVAIDADEAANRVMIGIDVSKQPQAQSEVARRLQELGVPEDAVRFVDMEPFTDATRLRAMRATGALANINLEDVPQPVVAGYRIIISPAGCTLGPVVERNGQGAALTASHCTPFKWELDGSVMRTSDGAVIGDEIADPAPAWCGDTACRYSDAALFDLRENVSYRRGAIARTIDVSYTWGTPGSLDVDQNDNFLAVLYVLIPSQVSQGLMLFKTGASTGTTGGNVSNTCTDIQASDFRIHRCSVVAGYYTGPGDSGSPVYQPNSQQAYLVGIFWGNNGESSAASYYSNAESELGGPFNALTNVAVSPSTISGSIYSATYPKLNWIPVAVANTTTPTTYHLRRRTWDAATQWYVDFDTDVLVTQSQFSHIDYARAVNLYYGSTQPPSSVNYVHYYILAENHGVVSVSNSVFFRRRNLF